MSDGRILSPWKPEQEQIRLAILGKLLEELGEAVAITARCVIQGVDENEPNTHRPNREALEDELADVVAGIALVTEHFGLRQNRMEDRAHTKAKHLKTWHAKLPL